MCCVKKKTAVCFTYYFRSKYDSWFHNIPIKYKQNTDVLITLKMMNFFKWGFRLFHSKYTNIKNIHIFTKKNNLQISKLQISGHMNTTDRKLKLTKRFFFSLVKISLKI